MLRLDSRNNIYLKAMQFEKTGICHIYNQVSSKFEMTEFNPPIKERTTEDLLEIVGAS